MSTKIDELVAKAEDALASLEESRDAYREACAEEERTGRMDPDAYEAWEDSVMDTHIEEVSDVLAALVDALTTKGA